MRGLAVVLLLTGPSIALGTAAFPQPFPETGLVYPYQTWETLTVELQQLVSANADIARLHSAGVSNLGFDLWVVEIADFQNPEKIPLESREVVWLDGGTHANEQLGMMLAYLWVEYLVAEYQSDATARWIVENRHTYIMPMVNPDGNHMDSRWNARGVNINRNYPVGWGAIDESVLGNNPGPYAASEPETMAIVAFIKAVRPDYFNSFHTGTDLMLYPVGYSEVLPKDDKVFQRICLELGETDPAFCGPVYSTIYPASGIAVDTAYFETGAVAWTYEVSPEGFMYASLEDPAIRLDRYWKGVEHAFLNVEKYGAHLKIASLSLLDTGAEAVVEAVIENDGYGDLQWADIAVWLPSGQTAATAITDIASGETSTLRFTIPKSGTSAGTLAIEFAYPKRLETSPLRETYELIPLAVAGGKLAVADTSRFPLGEPLTPTSENATPGPELGLIVLGVTGLAVGLRRRHR